MRGAKVIALSGLMMTIFLVPGTHADLVRCSWHELLTESTLIVRGMAQKLALESDGAGVAELRVNEVYRGQYRAPTLQIRWSSEVHDQEIDRLGSEYLLFLRREGSQYVAAQYGRSYWPIEHGPHNEKFVVYRGALLEVAMPEALVRRQMRFGFEHWPSPPCEAAVDIILLDKITPLLKEAK